MSLPLSRVAVALCSAGVVLIGGGVAAAASGPSPTVDVVSDETDAPPVVSPAPAVGDDDAQDVSDDEAADAAGDDAEEAADDAEGTTDAGTQDPVEGDDPAAEDGTSQAGGLGPDPTGPAHHGLCTAWSHVQDTPAANATAFRTMASVDCSDVVTTKGTDEGDDTTEDSTDGTTEDGTDDTADAPATAPATTSPKAKHSASTTTHTKKKSAKAARSTSKGSKGRSDSHRKH